MEIIEELEGTRRGPYAGAFGYLSAGGAMDMALTLRTMVVAGGRLHLQAGGGVVADDREQLGAGVLGGEGGEGGPAHAPMVNRGAGISQGDSVQQQRAGAEDIGAVVLDPPGKRLAEVRAIPGPGHRER